MQSNEACQLQPSASAAGSGASNQNLITMILTIIKKSYNFNTRAIFFAQSFATFANIFKVINFCMHYRIADIVIVNILLPMGGELEILLFFPQKKIVNNWLVARRENSPHLWRQKTFVVLFHSNWQPVILPLTINCSYPLLVRLQQYCQQHYPVIRYASLIFYTTRNMLFRF